MWDSHHISTKGGVTRTLLHGVDYKEIARRAKSQRVTIAADRRAATTVEGVAALELLTDLLSRLYPVIQFDALEPEAQSCLSTLADQALAINPNIEWFREAEHTDSTLAGSTVVVIFGDCAIDLPTNVKAIYAGSDGWRARVSRSGPQGCGTSAVPFGELARQRAFVAASVFRHCFGLADRDDPLRR